MNELVLPVAGSIVVFLVAVPLLTLAARAALALIPTRDDCVLEHGGAWRFSLVVGPTLGPVVWLVSAAIHQSEGDGALAACIVDHLDSEVCRDVVLFGVALFSVLGFGAVRRAGGDRAPARAAGRVDVGAARERLRMICRQNPMLAAFATRIDAVEAGIAPACTRGLIRPRIEVDAALVMRLEARELEAILLHEVEHLRARDPLRYFVAHVALSINPLGRLLSPELSRYQFAREALCDRHAVQRGADPLALARSIVSVAATGSPGSPSRLITALGGPGIGGVRVRVQLLLGYAARWPGPPDASAPVGLASALALTLAVLPHVLGTAPLDLLHHGVEHAALMLGLG